ncbi:CMRF35-like molecule 1 [Pipistrellus kuhlii]|uniref:CMRF35-like molecule 1 n=1 Tax=Pipistrellus kuhlii TaxID=59472 RepID=UPI001E26EE23|nr:CMRF35-like molecule 1 [Pipistrellus kuhlii]
MKLCISLPLFIALVLLLLVTVSLLMWREVKRQKKAAGIPPQQAPFLVTNVSYEALSLDTLDQDSIYSNTQGLVTPLSSRSQEALVQYSVIREP